ncbi:MAG: DUF4358 domain-containing protein [Oscillospiraceae bacterium]
MKKILMAMVLAAACLSLTACDKNTDSDNGSDTSSNEAVVASPAEKTASLLGSVEFPEMRKLDTADDLTAILGINAADLTDYSAYICPSGMAPDEFGVFVAKDEAAAAAIKTTIESRIQYQNDTFRDYPLAAAEVYKLNDAFVEVKGNVVSYAICADNTKAREILG